MTVWSDSNWAAPRSTSGWTIVWNGCILQMASKTRSTPALSSAEAEIVAGCEAAKEGRDSRWYDQVTNRAERLMVRLEHLASLER